MLSATVEGRLKLPDLAATCPLTLTVVATFSGSSSWVSIQGPRGVTVSALALENLLVDGVAVDVGHVVDHRVAEHVVEGGVQGQPFGVAADDDG
jgi:hypothetical protein